jgi:hypothetical protein
MKTEGLAKAIRATKGLTTQELQELKGHVSRLLQLGPGSADRAVASSNAPEELIMIAECCRDRGMPPVKVTDMMHGAQFDTFRVKLGPVRKFIARVGNKTAQRALFKLGLRLLHKDMEERRIAISYLSYLNEVHRIPGVINRAFPGYAQAGRLTLIIRGENHVRSKRGERGIQRDGRGAPRQ